MCDHQADGGARNQDGVTTGRSSRDRSYVHIGRLYETRRKYHRFDSEFRGNFSEGIGIYCVLGKDEREDVDVLEVPLATRLAPSAISIAVPACPFSKWRGEGTVEIRMPRSDGHVPATIPPRCFLISGARDPTG